MMDSKIYRLREFIQPEDGKSFIVDTSKGLSLGALPGLEQFSKAVSSALPLLDGLVIGPGQAGKLSMRTRKEAALLLRMDWTNAFRGPDFVLPLETIGHIPLMEPQAALDLGANGMVINFLLGHEEDIESACLHMTVQWALAGTQIGIPLIVDVHPIGPRVVLENKAVELGVSYSIEGGADGIAIPWPGADSFQRILTMAADVPVWLKPKNLDTDQPDMKEALAAGAAGLWLDERVFAQTEVLEKLKIFHKLVHPVLTA
jgi:DhnA family fructose-bisphosphate aldolase class Ia